ncbi:MAG: class I SAM-dependent methyltransferase [Chloroflexi bacterium]|nr:class I SAM-dependent methyltransferase [Chloroflexota bacterium]
MTDQDLIGLILLVNRLTQTNQPLGRATLVPFAEMKLPNVARNYDALVSSLLERKLAEGSVESFRLTTLGATRVREIANTYSLHAWFYNAYYQAVLRSPAHSLFCARVYGKDLCQHGMTDMAQIHLLLDALDVQAGMTLLDFGCGDGRIAEYISDTTRTRVVGVDIADRAIELACARTPDKRARLDFVCVDVERNPAKFPGEKFDRIVAIDSIFFVREQRAVLQVFLDHLKPQGRMGLFAHCPPNNSADQTALAQALTNLGIAYSVCDLSEQNREHWRKKKQTLLELESQFRAEGNDFLFKNRLAECDGLEHFHRYLYLTIF